MSRLLAAVLVLAACAHTGSLPHEELHDLVDCPWVAEGCGEPDGCSKTEGHAAESMAPLAACGNAVPYPQLVADARQQLRTKSSLDAVRIVAPTEACAAAVRAALDAPDRVETTVRPTRHVHVEVAAWNGARCGR